MKVGDFLFVCLFGILESITVLQDEIVILLLV